MKTKRITKVFLSLALLICSITQISAEENDPVDNLFDFYNEVYNTSYNSFYDAVYDDYSSYSFILHNENGFIIHHGMIELSNIIAQELSSSEYEVLVDFITRINNLLLLNEIKIDSDFRLYYSADCTGLSSMSQFAGNSINIAVYDLMTGCRAHATELRQVYDNAAFGTKNLVAGLYFAERVKTGGAWDLKQYLGTNNTYYILEVNSNMTGETIGNFHYGYVGRSVFSSTVLLSAAGMYQIISGTSSWGYYDTYFDEPNDQAAISWGIQWYEMEH